MKTFESICRAMARPDFYPHPVKRIQRRETHISVVFLTGDVVYKLKKPVDFGFLDYTDLQTRRRMCEVEVKLNQRLTEGVYLGVMAFGGKDDAFRMEEGGEGVEYAVRMRQLPDEASLSAMIDGDRATLDDMAMLGGRLATFYQTAARGAEVEPYGASRMIEFNCEENFRQLGAFIGDLLDKERFEFLVEASRGFLRDRRSLFERRTREGRICDGHGDLRAEHVYFLDRIEIIDCVEFSDRLRYGDSGVDLAFLHMDVERLGRPDLSLAMLRGYTEPSRDYGLYTVLDFYACYRALVKTKVSCLGAGGAADSSKRREIKALAVWYFDLAFGYAVRFARPTLYVVCGLPGSGKSAWAKRVADLFEISLFCSDEVRKNLPEYGNHSGPVAFGTGIYRPQARRRAYSRLLSAAQAELKRGRPVVLDATFSRRKWREEAVRLAEDLDATILFMECVSSKTTLLERLGRREGKSGKSDARAQHLPGLVEEFEGLDELSAERRVRIDTEAPIEENLASVLSDVYSKKRAQVERIIGRL
ncbi:MAG: AAA family ATPase [Syntrophobacteraceae bacterium]|nr:AAA family ATPase [Syntrophobacteraceae bacterium]